MTDANFNSLYQTINQQWPVSTQMNSLSNSFINTANYFNVYQASKLIQIVAEEASRLQLAKISYRSITDYENFIQIYNLLYTQAAKTELGIYLKANYNIGIITNLAMTDADFNTLFQTIKAQYLPFEQMNSLTSVFNNTSNYFASAQVKQLIPLVSLESNRLQLAKLSYRTIVDRNNFIQVYDELNSQASRNELDAYVKAYKN
jgi:phage baseplate assembly protein W